MTTPKIATPLSRKAVLVAVNISQWGARKLDRKVTRETNEKYHASQDAGRYNKLLIEQEHLAEITGIISKARALHYKLTLPWVDKGPRILPNVLFSKFAEEFRELKREFEVAADKFARGYPDFVEERKGKINGLFNPKDYPAQSEIRSKFDLDHQIVAFPDEQDFRADLDEDTLDDIRAELARTSGGVVDNTLKAAAAEIIEKVGHMSEKLAEYKNGPEGEKRFFSGSLVENVRELAGLLPAFNLTNDPNLAHITNRILKELCVEDAKELRKNDEARATVQKSADEIVAEVGKFFG
jgi:hypothetical protein